jgi:dTDP-D-glucose 4,6-dehydratase
MNIAIVVDLLNRQVPDLRLISSQKLTAIDCLTLGDSIKFVEEVHCQPRSSYPSTKAASVPLGRAQFRTYCVSLLFLTALAA